MLHLEPHNTNPFQIQPKKARIAAGFLVNRIISSR